MVKVKLMCNECVDVQLSRIRLQVHADTRGSFLLQKPPGTLPIRKHKLSATPGTGQAITKFFDRKEEQVRGTSTFRGGKMLDFFMHFQARLQQQLSKSRPAGPPPTFSAETTGSRAPEKPAASARATAVSDAVPSSGTSAAVHITSAASLLPDNTAMEGRLPKPAVSAKPLPVSENRATAAQPDLPLSAAGSEPKLYANDAAPATSSVVGVNRPRHKAPGQTSLDYVRLMTQMHARHACQLLTLPRQPKAS